MGWAFNPFTGKFDYFDKYTDAEAKAAAIAGWTASRALETSAGGTLQVSAVTLAELNYLDGVTSAIQAQIDAKLANIVEDTTPQLGGPLDAEGERIHDIGLLDFTTPIEITIASGAVTATQSFHTVDTEDDDPSDDLDTINGGSEGRLLFIRPRVDTRTVIVKHNTGNIWLKGQADITLDDIYDGLLLIYSGAAWFDVGAGIVAHDIGGASHNADTWANLKGKISDITNVTAAELEYVNGVTSAIQTQIDDNKILAFLGVK